VILWVRWDRIALPKSLGGWGLKNALLFSKALEGKVVWHLISTSSLWTRVLHQKYIAPLSILDRIRTDDKKKTGASIIWKAIILAFDLIGKWMAWGVGDGHKFLVGRDPWPGCGRDHILSVSLHNELEQRGITFLYQTEDRTSTTIWNQGWMDGVGLGL